MTALTPPLLLPLRPTPILTGYYVDGDGNYAPFSDAWLLESGSVGSGWAQNFLDVGNWLDRDRRGQVLRLVPRLLFATSWQPFVDWENNRLRWNDVEHVELPEPTCIALRALLLEVLHVHDQAAA